MATNPLQYLLFLLPLITADETAKYSVVELNQLPTIYLEQFYSDLFSEMNVFYEPRSNIAVPLISKPVGSIEKNLFNRIYGSLPCVCSLGGCDCCVDIKIKLLNVLQNGCVKLRSLGNDNNAIHTELELNQQSIIQRRVTFSDPPPLCVPVPRFPFVAGCIHFNRIVTQNGNLKGCVNLEFHVSGTEIVLWESEFSCFRIGMNGITFNRPNKKKEKPGKQCSNEKPPKH